MQLFVDMDGVLADFNEGHERAFGIRPCKIADNVNWKTIRSYEGFYAGLPLMEDVRALWRVVGKYNPIVLTGVPAYEVPEAEENKRAWFDTHRDIFGDVKVICCPARLKSRHCVPGDVIIDDWEKYRQKWEDAGGIWITHLNAQNTIVRLGALGIT